MKPPRAPLIQSRIDGTPCSRRFDPGSRVAGLFRHGAACVALLGSTLAGGQEMEPRSYSAVPVGTNFVVLDFARSSGGYSFDPSLPITNVHATINTWSLGLSHSFGVFGHTASLAMAVPYANANVTGEIGEKPEQAYRSGLGDAQFRLAVNLLGDPALTPEEFARRSPTTVLGASIIMATPTGQYMPSRLINLGSNRWSFKPELGLSQPFGNWFVEGAAGVWLFADNDDFFGGHRRSQQPMPVFQWHAGYNWRPGLWIAADALYLTGGRTSVNGVQDQDLQHSVRYGVTLSVPLAGSWSAKLAWSRGLITRVGGDFQIFSVALQYRWFNH